MKKPRTLNFDSDIALAEKVDNGIINAIDPNLRPFFTHGGKLLQYHGWNDWQIAPRIASTTTRPSRTRWAAPPR